MTMDLENIYSLFPQESDAIFFLESLVWPEKPFCPYCKSSDITSSKHSKRHHCNTCNTSFSVTVNSIFHRTKVDLQKWFLLLFIMSSGSKVPAVRTLSEELRVTKDTALKMINRVKANYFTEKELIDKILNTIQNGN